METGLHYRDSRLEVDEAQHIVRVDGMEQRLPPIQYRLLLLLLSVPGNLVRFSELTAAWTSSTGDVWNDQIKWQMGSLRKRLGGMIESVRSFGYKYIKS